MKLSTVFRGPFRPAPEDPDGKYYLVLDLQTGENVALLGSYARGAKACY